MAESEMPGQGSESAKPKEIVPQIASAWGTSRAYVYKLKRSGCPVHDVDAASKWREEHCSRGIGFRSKGKSLRKDSAPVAAATKTREERGTEDDRPADRVLASLWDSVQAAVQIESAAFRLVRDAQREGKDNVIAIRIAAYSKAQQGRFTAEEMYRKEMERQKILIPFEDAKRIGRRAYDIMLPLLRAMGKNIGPAVCPSDGLAAAVKIDAAVEAIIRAGRGAYEEAMPAEEPPMPVVKIEIPDDEAETSGTQEGGTDVGDQA